MGYFIRAPKLTELFSTLKNWNYNLTDHHHHKDDKNYLKDYSLLVETRAQDSKPDDVPKGYLAVYVGDEMRRYVIPAKYLCMPNFLPLMEKMTEEFGFQQTGGLRVPCEIEDFEEIIRVLEAKSRSMKKNKKVNIMKKNISGH